jgi:hypothetical protein
VDPALFSFPTEAVVELFGEKEKALVDEASEIGVSLIAELHLNFESPVELALLSFRAIRAARQVHPGYACRIAPFTQRQPHIQSVQAPRADTFLVQFKIDLGIETSLRRRTWDMKDEMVTVERRWKNLCFIEL